MKSRRSLDHLVGAGLSVSADPIESIVDAELDHLDAAVASGESITPKPWETHRNDKRPAVQPQILVLDLRRPTAHESPFDPSAQQPASAIVVIVEAGDRCAGRHVGEGEIVIAGPAATGLAIEQPGAIGPAEPSS